MTLSSSRPTVSDAERYDGFAADVGYGEALEEVGEEHRADEVLGATAEAKEQGVDVSFDLEQVRNELVAERQRVV